MAKINIDAGRRNLPLSFSEGKHHSVLMGRANSKGRRQETKGGGQRLVLCGQSSRGWEEMKKGEALWELEGQG